MSDALKPVSIPAAVAVTATAGGNSGEIISSASATTSNLPSALGNLSAGNVLAGIVVDRGRGNVILKTDRGFLQLTTNLALKLGSEVLLEVQSVGAQMRFTVVSVDHRPPSMVGNDLTSAQQLSTSAIAVPDDDRATLAPGVRSAIIGRLLTAEIVVPSWPGNPPFSADSIPVLLRRIASLTETLGNTASSNASAAINDVAERLPIVPNAEALERILTAVGGLAPDVVEALLDGPNSTTPARPAAVDNEAQPAGATLRNNVTTMETANGGNDVGVSATTPKLIAIRLLEVLGPMAGGLGPTGLLRPQATGNDSITLFGTVAHADANSAELTTPLGTLRLPNAPGLQIGSEIAFEIVADAASREKTQAFSATMATTMPQRTLTAEPPHDWPALRDIISALAQNTAINTDMILPKAGEMLGPALLAFFANLRTGGNAKAWLGKSNIDALDETVRDRLLDRLDGELSAESHIAGSPNSDGWQTTAVPIADGQRITEIRIHTQRRRKNHDGNEEANGSRFVIEATLSALGPLQLDGLVRMRRFDLIVRTARALPDEMRRDIETLFATSLSASGHLGGVSFRNDAAAWLNAVSGHEVRRSGVIA